MTSTHYLVEVLILLAAAVLVVGLFSRLRLTPLLGFIVAGAVIGPHGLALIAGVDTARALAELGVVFLLFMIGLELSFARLRMMGTLVFWLGGSQLLLTGLIFYGFARAFGASEATALVIGVGLAMSSTAIVLQILMDRRAQSTKSGRAALAILLFQDLALVPALALMPLLGDDQGGLGGDLLAAGAKAAAALALIVIIGRLALGRLLRAVERNGGGDMLTAAAMLIILGTAALTEAAGLSLALGAFLAGLLVAETEFRHQIEADIHPFRGLLLGLFFMTVGMGIDLEFAASVWPGLLASVAILAAIKALVILALGLAFRLGLAVSVHIALLLAQGGEFAFLLAAMAGEFGIIDNASSQFLLAIVTLSMATTPFLAIAGRRLGAYLAARESARDEERAPGAPAAGELEDHVIIAGFGRLGRTVAGILDRADIPYLAVDRNVGRVRRWRQDGAAISYGDAGRTSVLQAAGLARAAAVVITVDDPQTVEHLVAAVRQNAPDLPILARAHDHAAGRAIAKAGATKVVQETFEASLQLASDLLDIIGTESDERDRLLAIARDDAETD